MAPSDTREIERLNRARRARRVRELKRSLARHQYRVDAESIARDMIRNGVLRCDRD